MSRRFDPLALAPIATSLASAAVELTAVAELARGQSDAATWILAIAGWAGLACSALAGLALAERRP